MHFLILTAYCYYTIIFLASACLAEDFPFREKYPEIEIIALADLKTGYDKHAIITVDLRSTTEFESIHIDGATNLPFGNLKFLENLLKLAKNNPNKKIVVYDNGIDCLKCYRSAEDPLYSTLLYGEFSLIPRDC